MTVAALKVDVDLLAPDQFRVTVPGGPDRYGVTVGRNRETVYKIVKEMKDGPLLTLRSLSASAA